MGTLLLFDPMSLEDTTPKIVVVEFELSLVVILSRV